MADTSKKQKAKRYISPVGTAIYPKLNRPDEYQGKKRYKVTLRIPQADAAELEEMVREATSEVEAATRKDLTQKVQAGKTGQEKAKAKKALESLEVKYPFALAVDDDGNETDELDFNFATNAEFKDKKTEEMVAKTVPLFDAAGKPMKKSIWGGSRLSVAYEMFPYYNPSSNSCGISLRIAAVQVLELVSGSGGSAESFGFAKHEDGYVEEDADEPAEGAAKADASAEDGDPDF